MDIPRAEYPRPQCVRDDGLSLNGEWQFETDQGDSGLERGFLDRDLQGSASGIDCWGSRGSRQFTSL